MNLLLKRYKHTRITMTIRYRITFTFAMAW